MAIDYSRDAVDWGNALNSAGWCFIMAYDKIIGTPMPPLLFNNIKPILREVIINYLEEVKKEEQ